jgi:hypothetical protein
VPAQLRRLTDTAYLAAGLAAFLVAGGVQYGLYAWLLRPAFKSGAFADARPAFVRWIIAALVWQGVVIVAAGAYMVMVGRAHPPGLAWAAPPLAALLGTALPLQLVASAAMQAARR